MMNTNFNDMSTVKTEKELKHTIKFQGNMISLGNWIIATRWAWDFDKGTMATKRSFTDILPTKAALRHKLPSQSPMVIARALRAKRRLVLELWE